MTRGIISVLLLRPLGRHAHRGPGVCQLWLRVHAAVAQGRHRALPVQRLWPVPQDERHQPAAHQTTEATGKTSPHLQRELPGQVSDCLPRLLSLNLPQKDF